MDRLYRVIFLIALLLAGISSSHAGKIKMEEMTIDELKAAAAKGDPVMEMLLATIYVQGNSLPRNVPEAAKLYEDAARQGNCVSQLYLGQFYMDGYVLRDDSFTWPKDPVEAAFWLSLAADPLHCHHSLHDMKYRVELLEEVKRQLTAEQITEIEKRAKAWLPQPSAIAKP